MIEADIIYGTLANDNSNNKMPVMGHPPQNQSDISLETFLATITSFNAASPKRCKGIKLDFKSTEVFLSSSSLLESKWSSVSRNSWSY